MGGKGRAALQMGSAEGWVFKAYLNIITFKILNIVSIQMESWGGQNGLSGLLVCKGHTKKTLSDQKIFSICLLET